MNYLIIEFQLNIPDFCNSNERINKLPFEKFYSYKQYFPNNSKICDNRLF